ncbi:MAG: zinc ribbon domain-containing protein [Chloroflexi bacterium]|nr:zinc ribbon domain-containing protein [Chloroflexota bacterium]
MPLYEYVCPQCDTRFEKLRPMTDGVEAQCPRCSTPARRVISLFAAFTRGEAGESRAVAGGGCACSAGGACGCAGE